jgi:hypothetical protein
LLLLSVELLKLIPYRVFDPKSEVLVYVLDEKFILGPKIYPPVEDMVYPLGNCVFPFVATPELYRFVKVELLKFDPVMSVDWKVHPVKFTLVRVDDDMLV